MGGAWEGAMSSLQGEVLEESDVVLAWWTLGGNLRRGSSAGLPLRSELPAKATHLVLRSVGQ